MNGTEQYVQPALRDGWGFFDGTELPLTSHLGSLCRASLGMGPSLRFVHARALRRYPSSGELVYGETWFGPGRPASDWIGASASVPSAAVESVSLRDAVLFPTYITVFSPELGVYRPSAAGFTPESLSRADSTFVFRLNGTLEVPSLDAIDFFDGIGIPICGVGFNNYGHFLLDGLPLGAVLVEKLRSHGAYLIGPPLAAWQRHILQAADIEERYLVLTQPRRFRRIVTSSILSGHVGAPTRFTRVLFDRIRLWLGVHEERRERRIFISRPDRPGRRYLENRAEVESCVQRYGFETVQPEHLSFPEQVRLFAAADVVAGEYGAAMANVGFCDPGCRVLEIVPETHPDGWVRGLCSVFSHRWHVYFASVENPAIGADRDDFRYRIDVGSLEAAVRKVCRN
ncbi:MAG: glycosyltransferase family 61 protein [Rhodospirillales bacterium]|nr:glycosyltransferase family 61 protein [Rhodospirillales bacterium]